MSVEEIIAKHQSNGRRLCYAQSLGPITVRHQFSDRIAPKVLRCTEPFDHEGDHRDGACCWRPHTFSREMAGPSEPEYHNLQQCVECERTWPCDVAKIGEMLPISQTRRVDELVNAITAIGEAWDEGDLARAVRAANYIVQKEN